MLDPAGGPGQDRPEHVLFQHQPHRKVEAPQNEVPTGPVPKAGAKPHDEDVTQRFRSAAPVAPQGDIQVLPEPSSQRHVPPAPELRHRRGQIRIVKVFIETEAEDPPQTDGHVRIAGEVKVDLEAEGEKAHPASQHRQLPRPLGGQAILPQRADGVGQQHLLGKTHAEPAGA